ncbi:MAG: 2-dehydropantoate 2-reductase [Gammaproteobacteria bacterium]|nr:2-dehydropantoate 2-reductase [Gammaproteobacteria bacterium]
MRVNVFGAGAVGGNIAARLAAAGNPISVVARGESLAAMRRDGILVHAGSNTIHAEVEASDDPRDLGAQDVVIVTVKATSPARLAASLAPLVGPDTDVVFAQNGIPWWYRMGLSAGRPAPPELGFLDPGGELERLIAAEHIIGGVIYSSNEVTAPGVVVNETPGRNILHLGRADDRSDERLDALRAMLERAGINAPRIDDIRQAIWGKLVVNMSLSVLCLLTGRKATVVREDERLADVFLAIAAEALGIAAAHGIDTRGLDPRSFLVNPPDHLPSIRQDYDRGRALELDALVLAPQAFGRAAGIETPHLDTIAALAVRMGTDHGLYP